ncbi:hypothetical protein [Legionella septentrionalis]|uniref:hypothetical protein n=1 Tax=Legionella septentrionalis TaxID=2498109 RepID=UPI000F8DD5E1|nr:hypothetical protein [Legionella septentrionalis]RUR12522.1 hypothetical protein ELY10_11480 [Legionella septentrionalis]
MGLMPATFDTYPIEHATSVSYSINRRNSPSELYSGSGGGMISFFSTTFSGETSLAIEKINENYNISKVIDLITDCFKLTKDELKTICHIGSRKTLYNWIDGTSTPRASTLERLFDLYSISKAWMQKNYTNNVTQLRQPILNDESVIEMLKKPNINKEQILFVGARLSLSTLEENNVLKDPFSNEL